MPGIFITATGTEIGKTYITCRLLQWDQAHRCRLVACKPVISGWPSHENEIHQTDTALLLKASRQPITPETLHEISPWRFHLPLTPAMAARAEGQDIVPTSLISYCRQRIEKAKRDSKCVLIEGVGGIMSPISARFTVLDWIESIDCPCILIGGSYLGTLSHTLTAVEVLRMRKVDVLAIVINETVNSTVSLDETCRSLQSFLPYPIIAVPRTKQLAMENQAVSRLYKILYTQTT